MAQPNDETIRSVPQSSYSSSTPDPQPSNLRRRCPPTSNQAASSTAQQPSSVPQSSSANIQSTPSTTPSTQQIPSPNTSTTQPTPQQNNNNNDNTFRARAVVSAVGLGLVTATVGGTYLLSENETIFPFAVAACVLTFSSVLIRLALFGINPTTASHRARTRHFRHHRHFTGERAAYVRTSQRLAMMDRDFTAADYELLLDLDNNSQRLRRFLEGASRETVDSLPTYFYKKKLTDATEQGVNQNINDEDDQMKEIEKEKDETNQSILKNEMKEIDSKECSPSKEPELAGATAGGCTICLEDFEEGMKIRILPCFHHFMADCIDPWLQQQARCPVCKFSIHEGMNTLPPGCT